METKLSGLEELKAVAHPLRVSMLAHLREHGPATATELARQLTTDTGSTSYHLRKLAEFGFVVEIDNPDGHHRARRWSAVHRHTSWSNAEMAGSAEGRQIMSFFHGRQTEKLVQDLQRLEATVADLPKEWAGAFGMSDDVVRLTAQSLAELWQRFEAEVERLSKQDADDPGARPVSLILAGLPR